MSDAFERARTVIVGGGAAGFFAAIHNKLATPGQPVIIIEKGSEVLTKVKISGGGRCNVTHACFDPKQLCDFYPRGHRELRGPFHSFQPQDTMDWFESHGVPLKIEADNRVFPKSDSSQSIIDCLVGTAEKLGVKIWTQCAVKQISAAPAQTGSVQSSARPHRFTLSLSNGHTLLAEKLILATGSARQGYDLARNLGHTIVPPVPSLFTFKIADSKLHQLSGLSVPDATAWLKTDKKKPQSGPVLITHWGLSGPAIIKLSAWHARALHEARYSTTLWVNWLPQLEAGDILDRLTQTRHGTSKKMGTQSPFPAIPKRLWHYLVARSGISSDQPWNGLNQRHINRLVQELTMGEFEVCGKGMFKEEFVTCGGVILSEINFKTMESKVCPGLHIVGELLDIDGVTGGFNFQNAWTTGMLSATQS